MEIQPGQLGFINHGGLPKILTRPGRYPGFPMRNWWAREWEVNANKDVESAAKLCVPFL